MADARHALGRSAEDAAARWLMGLGWRILARRWRVAEGELDVVALDGAGTLVGVEVRARSSTRAGSALESVDARRVARLRRALARYAVEVAPPHTATRLDLVSLRREQTEAGPRWRATRLEAIDGW
jgi:putative endonuclease